MLHDVSTFKSVMKKDNGKIKLWPSFISYNNLFNFLEEGFPSQH